MLCRMMNLLVLISLVLASSVSVVAAFATTRQVGDRLFHHDKMTLPSSQLLLHGTATTAATTTLFMANDNDDKFSFGQRIESLKCVVVGAVSGGIALAPFSGLHDVFLGGNGVAQWEFDTDMGSLEAALFAIVYRYAVRKDDNPMLNMGVVGAFVFCRTLSRIQVPSYCTAVPLDCKIQSLREA